MTKPYPIRPCAFNPTPTPFKRSPSYHRRPYNIVVSITQLLKKKEKSKTKFA